MRFFSLGFHGLQERIRALSALLLSSLLNTKMLLRFMKSHVWEMEHMSYPDLSSTCPLGASENFLQVLSHCLDAGSMESSLLPPRSDICHYKSLKIATDFSSVIVYLASSIPCVRLCSQCSSVLGAG